MSNLRSEAKRWQAQLGSDSPLTAALANVNDRDLGVAYSSWWRVYSDAIRTAPSNRGGQGVSARDAGAAVDRANRSVLAYLAKGDIE